MEYKKQVKYAAENNLEKPRVPESVGLAILLIAQRLASRPNFANYIFVEDMISDGYENTLKYIDNFDPEYIDPVTKVNKPASPFSYFTKIIYFAFLRRIEFEKKLLESKLNYEEVVNIANMTSDRMPEDNGRYSDEIKHSFGTKQYNSEFIYNQEERRRKKKLKNARK